MKSPAFQFYAADFIADENVVVMSNEEVGCYIKLMCYCWREGSIPSDLTKMGRMCGVDGLAMAQLWPAIQNCFSSATNETGRLVHPRLEEERKKQNEFRAERSEAGKHGAKSRWGNKKHLKAKPSKNNGSATVLPMAKDGSSSSSSSSNNTPAELAGEIYEQYPRKIARAAGIKAIIKALNRVDSVTLREKTIAYAKSVKGKDPQYIPHPATWFNEERYSDPVEQPRQVQFKVGSENL